MGTPTVLREDKHGAYYEVELFDASYVNDVKPALRAVQLGASFRFKVTGEESDYPSKASAHNPKRLEERTITGIELYEFGPVTFPAYAGASAGLRTDAEARERQRRVAVHARRTAGFDAHMARIEREQRELRVIALIETKT